MAQQIRVGFAPPQLSLPNQLLIWATRWSSPGQKEPGDFYLIAVRKGFGPFPLNSPQEIRPQYIARFGEPPAGSLIWVKTQTISSAGLLSAPRIASTIVL